MPIFTSQRSDSASGPVLSVIGEIDMSVAAEFADALHRVIDDARSPAYVDLTGVTFFDSSGISALCAARRHAEYSNVVLVVHPSRQVRSTVEIVGLADMLFHGPAPAGAAAGSEVSR